MFTDAAAYERFMGRWSRPLGPVLLDWAGVDAPGRFLDVGVGTGAISETLCEVYGGLTAVGLDVAPEALAMAEARLADSRVPVRRSGLDGQSLPFADASHDAALSTWTLCTIPDVDAALREVRRVLKPGGTLHFVEHGLAPDEPVRRWQRRLEPLQKRLFGGCHLTRSVVELLTGGGAWCRYHGDFDWPGLRMR